MIEMISINSFHESKNNVRLIKRKSSNRKNMKTISFSRENIAKIFGKLRYFEIEFFVSCKESKSGICFTKNIGFT